MDVSGEQQLDVDHHLFKQRIDLEGNKLNEEPEKESKKLKFMTFFMSH